MSSEQSTHFGFQTIEKKDKARRVGQVFSSVANRYDVMNDLMSGGLHRLWKDSMVNWVRPRPGEPILDVAGGTGDIAFRMARAAGKAHRITISDINESMLSEGRRRADERGLSFEWLLADAECLPLPDRSQAAYTIALGIRNVTDRAAALAEAYRVLRPGGRFVCLEFSRLMVPMLDGLYDAYSFRVIPAIGRWVARDSDSYQYLVESIRRFPDQTRFAQEIAAAGFSQIRTRPLSGGIVAIHSGRRI